MLGSHGGIVLREHEADGKMLTGTVLAWWGAELRWKLGGGGTAPQRHSIWLACLAAAGRLVSGSGACRVQMACLACPPG